jgi:hypothetical protein
MREDVVEILCRCYRAGRDGREDARVLKAVREARKDPTRNAELERQLAFDEAVSDAIHRVEAPDALTKKVCAAAFGGSGGTAWTTAARHPAILAVVIGLLVIAFFVVYFSMKELDDFQGRDAMVELIRRTDSMSGDELDPTDMTAGDLRDWMAMHGLEDFEVPTPFAGKHVVGRRTFTHGGNPVVQLAIESDGVILMLFRERDFGIDPKAVADWRVVTADGWASAVRGWNGECVAVTFPGTEAEMREYLSTLAE